ncbi:MAG: hypothetical protein ACLFN9_18650 [Desulfococcaceae bacterium]
MKLVVPNMKLFTEKVMAVVGECKFTNLGCYGEVGRLKRGKLFWAFSGGKVVGYLQKTEWSIPLLVFFQFRTDDFHGFQ